MLNIVIPAAGKGTRFSDAGYTIPKPYLPIGDKTMLEAVMDNVKPGIAHRFIVIKPEDVPETTQGAACTVLLKKDEINNDDPLLIANSDQLVDWKLGYQSQCKIDRFLCCLTTVYCDACIVTLPTSNPRYSFAEITGNNEVIRTAEKKPISNYGTVGIYYFKHGKDFVKAAERMIEDNDRYNNEFYVCPVFNYLPRTKRIGYYNVPYEAAHFLGAPKEYEEYIATL